MTVYVNILHVGSNKRIADHKFVNHAEFFPIDVCIFLMVSSFGMLRFGWVFRHKTAVQMV